MSDVAIKFCLYTHKDLKFAPIYTYESHVSIAVTDLSANTGSEYLSYASRTTH